MASYHLTEEIARWAFEILCRERNNWTIAFTNPTAGPWKTIKAKDRQGNTGEVYRFALEENRPDIVLINDNLKMVVIIEAKDSLAKLVSDVQDAKTIEVVEFLSKIFKGLKTNPYWGERCEYAIVNGLLWGSEGGEAKAEIEAVFDRYHADAQGCVHFETEYLIGIESNKHDDGTIVCKLFTKGYNNSIPVESRLIAESFGIEWVEF